MNPGPSLTVETNVQPALNPRFMQFVKILSMPVLDLRQFLQKEAEDNPFLEVVWCDGDLSWGAENRRNRRGGSLRAGYVDGLERFGRREETLEETLAGQLRLKSCPSALYRIAEYIIGNLNDNGYLEMDERQISEALGVSPKEVEEALRTVQSLDPPGIAARNLKECLLLQIERDAGAPPAASAMVKDCLEMMAAKKWKAIAKTLGIPVEEAVKTFNYIRRLNPRPGLPFAPFQRETVVPDVTIRREGGTLNVMLNETLHLKVAVREPEFMKHPGLACEEAVRYFHEKSRHARNLLHCLRQRKQTLFRVVGVIAERQSDYFARGPGALKPMQLADVARELGLHESTVSRAIQNKYAQTPWGTVPLKSFFPHGMMTEDNGMASSTQIRLRIKEWIEQEDKRSPLSDQSLAELLQKEGIRISRRTVMKYREQMGILSSRLRGEKPLGKASGDCHASV
ncbi:MAG TPA: RNA polymerase factor sigma-54 [Paenibacillaceae bacterium]|jgi:RNA polymerase sigma-54 factor